MLGGALLAVRLLALLAGNGAKVPHRHCLQQGDVLLLLALAGISGSLRLSSVFCRFSACASRSCDHATQGTANLAVQHSTTFQKHAQCNLQQDPCPAVTVKALQECVPVWSAASSPKNICCCGLSSTRYVLLPGRPICAQ